LFSIAYGLLASSDLRLGRSRKARKSLILLDSGVSSENRRRVVALNSFNSLHFKGLPVPGRRTISSMWGLLWVLFIRFTSAKSLLRQVSKGRGKWVHLYRAIDSSGELVDVMLSEGRDLAAAKAFFRGAQAVAGQRPSA
jgi:hypothetical protein